jgi:tRNA (guanine-N7-)-methyltransferase
MAVGVLPERPAIPPTLWLAVFGTPYPVAIEIGPGRGEFLRTMARARPDWNFLAIERSAARGRAVARLLERDALTNARILCADATCLLAQLPPASVAALFVQFPDPWWKRRHHKRRVWTPSFVATVRHILARGATVEFLTDVEETFTLGLACLDADGGFERLAADQLLSHETSFGRKALRRGGTIYRCLYRRR